MEETNESRTLYATLRKRQCSWVIKLEDNVKERHSSQWRTLWWIERLEVQGVETDQQRWFWIIYDGGKEVYHK